MHGTPPNLTGTFGPNLKIYPNFPISPAFQEDYIMISYPLVRIITQNFEAFLFVSGATGEELSD